MKMLCTLMRKGRGASESAKDGAMIFYGFDFIKPCQNQTSVSFFFFFWKLMLRYMICLIKCVEI
jgi:hypothetical protein